MPGSPVKSACAWCSLLTVVAFATGLHATEPATLKDFTDVSLAELKIEPVPEKKDPQTGFVVGGKNATESIRRMTELNGRAIADLERDMRPGASSAKGFLGLNEKLLDVLSADNQLVVDEHRLTHRELARHLRILAAVGHLQGKDEFLYHGRRFQVSLRHYRGYQDSPFHDGTKASSEATVKNLTNGKTLEYSLLVPDMIERYGFYEGRGTPYRVDPVKALAVLDFLAGKKS